MDELQRALAELGLSWAEVWVLRADRRAGTLVIVAADGRKFTRAIKTEFLPKTRFLEASGEPAAIRRVKAIKSIKAQSDAGQE